MGKKIKFLIGSMTQDGSDGFLGQLNDNIRTILYKFEKCGAKLTSKISVYNTVEIMFAEFTMEVYSNFPSSIEIDGIDMEYKPIIKYRAGNISIFYDYQL